MDHQGGQEGKKVEERVLYLQKIVETVATTTDGRAPGVPGVSGPGLQHGGIGSIRPIVF